MKNARATQFLISIVVRHLIYNLWEEEEPPESVNMLTKIIERSVDQNVLVVVVIHGWDFGLETFPHSDLRDEFLELAALVERS